jgi:PAS domain S-box-containing protein
MNDGGAPVPFDPEHAAIAWQRLRFALGAAGLGTWHVDLRTGVASHDEHFNRILGLAAGDTTGSLDDPAFTQVHPEDGPRVAAAIANAIATRSEYHLEFRIIRCDGAVRWLRDRGRVILDEHGEPLFATGAVMDVTEQRRVEQHDRILAAVTEALATSVNEEQTLTSVCGILSQAFAGSCNIDVHSAEGEAADIIRTGLPRSTAHLLALPLRAGGKVVGAMTLRVDTREFDATDLALATELAHRIAVSIDRARLFRELEQANRVKDEFLATLSHELRTPLNAVLGWTRMLRRGAVSPDRTASILETIERNAAAQTQLVEELLDLSAMTSGGLRLNVTRVDLRDLLGGAVETVRPAADAKALRINLSVDDSVGDLAGDPARLRQVLWNLLANAVKFTPPAGQIDVAVIEGPADVEITVHDNGPGIPSDFLPHVFEPFRQADSPATRMVGGIGLGLAIVRHIVEAHGGTVSAQSGGDRQGSTFCVRLPSGRPQASSSPRTGDTLRGRRVLAVDDDESTQELVATMLLMYGVSVRTAGHASQAMEILREWRPDVLLTDIAMPGEDGYAFMRRVRSLPAPLGLIPAVALTAYTDPHSMQQAFSAGFDAHLGKPLEPHVLADALSKVMRLRQGRG